MQFLANLLTNFRSYLMMFLIFDLLIDCDIMIVLSNLYLCLSIYSNPFRSKHWILHNLTACKGLYHMLKDCEEISKNWRDIVLFHCLLLPVKCLVATPDMSMQHIWAICWYIYFFVFFEGEVIDMIALKSLVLNSCKL